MARYEDYVNKDQEENLSNEVNAADQQQETREASTSTVDWEQRYKELERLNSRQAQDLGAYRKLVDEYIAGGGSTPEQSADESEQPSPTISDEDWYDNPSSAVLKAVESHPAIQDAKRMKESIEKQQRDQAMQQFTTRHSDYQEIGSSPEFQNWVADDPMRMELFQRADRFDLSAADALFSLYKAEKGIKAAREQEDLRAVELESSSAQMVQEPPKYSRSEYVDKLMRARQGDLEAETWVKRNAAGYREALTNGNVRD